MKKESQGGKIKSQERKEGRKEVKEGCEEKI